MFTTTYCILINIQPLYKSQMPDKSKFIDTLFLRGTMYKCVFCAKKYKTAEEYKNCCIKCSKKHNEKLLWCKWGDKCVNARRITKGEQCLQYHYERHLQWKNYWCKRCNRYEYNSGTHLKKKKKP